MNRRILINDEMSLPFTILYSSKYKKENIEEIIKAIDIILIDLKNKYDKRKLTTPKIIIMDNKFYYECFKILGFTTWQIDGENIGREYRYLYQNRQRLSSDYLESYFFNSLQENEINKEILKKYEVISLENIKFNKANDIIYFKKYKELDFSKIKEHINKLWIRGRLCELNYRIVDKLSNIDLLDKNSIKKIDKGIDMIDRNYRVIKELIF